MHADLCVEFACSSGDMRADRETHRHARRDTLSRVRFSYLGVVKSGSPCAPPMCTFHQAPRLCVCDCSMRLHTRTRVAFNDGTRPPGTIGQLIIKGTVTIQVCRTRERMYADRCGNQLHWTPRTPSRSACPSDERSTKTSESIFRRSSAKSPCDCPSMLFLRLET